MGSKMNKPTIRHERMSDIFSKYHLDGLPVDAVIHYFDKAEPADAPYHDHPFDFVSFIISGGYTEEIKYHQPEDNYWHTWHTRCLPGTSRQVKATDIHKITHVAPGGCYTLILPGPWKRKSGFWRFDENGAKFREWDQPEFQLVNNKK